MLVSDSRFAAGYVLDRFLAAIDPDTIDGKLAVVRDSGRLALPDGPELKFREKQDLVFNKRESLPYHPNGMRFMAFDTEGTRIAERDYYSVGGGFVVNHDAAAADRIRSIGGAEVHQAVCDLSEPGGPAACDQHVAFGEDGQVGQVERDALAGGVERGGVGEAEGEGFRFQVSGFRT